MAAALCICDRSDLGALVVDQHGVELEGGVDGASAGKVPSVPHATTTNRDWATAWNDLRSHSE